MPKLPQYDVWMRATMWVTINGRGGQLAAALKDRTLYVSKNSLSSDSLSLIS